MSCPSCFMPRKETHYPLYRRLGETHSRSGWVWKISSPPGFHPNTIQPVASHYTDYPTLTHIGISVQYNCILSEACTSIFIAMLVVVIYRFGVHGYNCSTYSLPTYFSMNIILHPVILHWFYNFLLHYYYYIHYCMLSLRILVLQVDY
jgi:hypothetical protein